MRNFFLSYAKKKFSNCLRYTPQNYGKFSGNLGDANCYGGYPTVADRRTQP